MDVQIKKNINKDLILRERLAIERTIMSNNTTLLAFIRTSLYFAVAGLSLNNLLKVSYGFWIEAVCWAFALTILVVGIAGYIRQRRKIRESEMHVGDYKLKYETEN
jgi:putative membrane protein